MSEQASIVATMREAQHRLRLSRNPDRFLLRLFDLEFPGASASDIEGVSKLRRSVLEHGYLTSSQLRDESNPSLLGVLDHLDLIYPAFQFEEGTSEPLPKAAVINIALGSTALKMRPWEIAMWWVSANGELDGATPVEALQKPDPEDLLMQAAYAEIYT